MTTKTIICSKRPDPTRQVVRFPVSPILSVPLSPRRHVRRVGVVAVLLRPAPAAVVSVKFVTSVLALPVPQRSPRSVFRSSLPLGYSRLRVSLCSHSTLTAIAPQIGEFGVDRVSASSVVIREMGAVAKEDWKQREARDEHVRLQRETIIRSKCTLCNVRPAQDRRKYSVSRTLASSVRSSNQQRRQQHTSPFEELCCASSDTSRVTGER